MATIYTERLLLRPVSMTDLGDVFEYSRQENVGPNAGWKPHATMGETADVMRAMFVGKGDIFGIVRRDCGTLIGTIGFAEDARRENVPVKMLGYAIGEKHWGRGYTTEASLAVLRYGFDALGLAMVSAYCYTGNARSARVLEKCGFRQEGTLREAEMLYNGKIRDVECYSLTAAEFACNTAAKQV